MPTEPRPGGVFAPLLDVLLPAVVDQVALDVLCLSDDEQRDRTELTGWALAALGSVGGARLLQERREPRGLEMLLELLSRGLGLEGRPVASRPAGTPRLAPGVGAGWELPIGITALLLEAARGLPPGRALAWCWSAEARAWRLAWTASGRVPAVGEDPLGERLAELLPEARLERRAGEEIVEHALEVPRPWLRAPGSAVRVGGGPPDRGGRRWA